jgi:hypothetical protein
MEAGALGRLPNPADRPRFKLPDVVVFDRLTADDGRAQSEPDDTASKRGRGPPQLAGFLY